MKRHARVRKCPSLVAFVFAAVGAACGPSTDEEAGVSVVVDTVGDTVSVRTLAGGVWGDTARLVAELSIGELEGADEYLFGSLSSLAVAEDGTIYVLDRQAAHVRAFDAEGAYRATLGRRGEGPGELSGPNAIALLSDGRLLVRDARNQRVQVYHPGGSTEEWRYEAGGYSTSAPLWTDAHDRTWVVTRDMTQELGAFGTVLIRFAADGTPSDTVRPPDADFEAPFLEARRESEGGVSTSRTNVPFAPTMRWTVHPSGGVLVGVGDVYTVDLRRDDGSVLRVGRAYDPVPIVGAERQYHQDRTLSAMRRTDPRWTWDGPPIPDAKPAFRDVMAGRDGRIWVAVSAPGVERPNPDHDPSQPGSQPSTWSEPRAFDVFEPDGAYLGVVVPPEEMVIYPAPVFRGDQVWSITRDELGIERVVRYRIAIPGSS